MRDGPHIGDGSDNELTDVRRLHSDVRQQFASYLSGSGIEIGPGHTAFPVPPGVDVRYVDRWSAAQQRALFPELADSDFRERDFEIDLDLERLSAFAAATQDFVIASHILEHLANPLAMVQEIHRVLRSGGLLVLLLPDYHVTFDRGRKPTSIEHLVDEYRRDVARLTTSTWPTSSSPSRPTERRPRFLLKSSISTGGGRFMFMFGTNRAFARFSTTQKPIWGSAGISSTPRPLGTRARKATNSGGCSVGAECRLGEPPSLREVVTEIRRNLATLNRLPSPGDDSIVTTAENPHRPPGLRVEVPVIRVCDHGVDADAVPRPGNRSVTGSGPQASWVTGAGVSPSP